MSENLLNALAVRILEVWALSLGLIPGSWNENDPNCRREYGPNVVWTIEARVPDGEIVDRQALWESLNEYIDNHNRLPGSIRFGCYDIQTYEYPPSGDFIFASIYQ
jgi:hypothetical protein